MNKGIMKVEVKRRHIVTKAISYLKRCIYSLS